MTMETPNQHKSSPIMCLGNPIPSPADSSVHQVATLPESKVAGWNNLQLAMEFWRWENHQTLEICQQLREAKSMKIP